MNTDIGAEFNPCQNDDDASAGSDADAERCRITEICRIASLRYNVSVVDLEMHIDRLLYNMEMFPEIHEAAFDCISHASEHATGAFFRMIISHMSPNTITDSAIGQDSEVSPR